jgi:hypothetical protein
MSDVRKSTTIISLILNVILITLSEGNLKLENNGGEQQTISCATFSEETDPNPKYEGVSKIFRTDALNIINLNTNPL